MSNHTNPHQPYPLPRNFFDRPTLKVAKDLLGKYLLRETQASVIQTRIVDVEAYVGPEDRASHASRGRTKRTEVMFGPSGVVYVYLIYGMYHCLNLVTERIDFPAAILIRGIEVVENGMGRSDAPTRIDGPGRVCRFLEIDRNINRMDATEGKHIWVEDRGENISPKQIQKLPRVGVNYAGEWAQKPWRFCLPAAPIPVKGTRTRPSKK
jgi:DNA-3-methyladenine glycosylase